jgi:L-lactate dehydrogenase (cytochrome)
VIAGARGVQVSNAEAHGCRALFITVDAPQLGRRDKDLRQKTVGAKADI